MKYFYLTFSFCAPNGVQGTGYKVCGCSPEAFKISSVILELNKQFGTTLVTYSKEISKADFNNFSEESRLVL